VEPLSRPKPETDVRNLATLLCYRGETIIPGSFTVRPACHTNLCEICRMSGMIHPEWWTGSLADAQERVFADGSTFGEAVDFLVADFLTSGRFLSFLVAATATRTAEGYALDEAIYAVMEEAAARLHAPPLELTAGGPGRPHGR
jgi:hypothetical protein